MENKESAYRLPDDQKAYDLLNRKINYLLSLILLIFILGLISYSGEFDFWSDPLSALGEIYPDKANPNLLAFAIFLTGMLGCSIVSFKVSQELKQFFGHNLFKITGVGFIFLSMPSNQLNNFHSLGGALVVGSLWWYCVVVLHELFKKSKKLKILAYQFILQITVLPYAFLYFSGLPERQAAQKFAVLGLIFVIKFTTSELLNYLEKLKEK